MGRVYCFMNRASALLFPLNIAQLLLANFIGLNPCQGFVRVSFPKCHSRLSPEVSSGFLVCNLGCSLIFIRGII